MDPKTLPAAAAACAWALLILPPLHLRLAGRGGDLFPFELVLPIVAAVALWRRGFQIPDAPCLRALALFLCACLPATLHASDLARHAYGLMLFGSAFLLLLVTIASRPRLSTLDRFIRWSTLPATVIAILVLATAAARGLAVRVGQGKMATVYGGSNFLASMLLLAAFVPLAVAIGGRARRERRNALVVFGLLAASVIATGSRLAMGVLPVGCVATVLLIRLQMGFRWRRLLGPALALSLVLVMLLPLLAAMLRLGRFDDPLAQQSWVGRILIFDLYWSKFIDSPWVGNGLFNVRATPLLTLMGEGGQESWGAHVGAHNWLLQCLADTGIAGSIAFIGFLIVAGRTFLAGLQRPHPWRLHATGWCVGFLCVLLHGLFEPNFHGKPFIGLFVVELGLAEHVRRRLAALAVHPAAFVDPAVHPAALAARARRGKGGPTMPAPRPRPGTALA
jgi:O-antigen ligase